MKTKIINRIFFLVASFPFLLSCSNGTVIAADNSKSFELAENIEKKYSSFLYDYSNYFTEIPEEEKYGASFACYNRFDYEVYYNYDFDNLKLELPNNRNSNKKYVIWINGDLDLASYSTMYASTSFTAMFDNYLNICSFSKSITSKNYIKIGTICEKERSYYVYQDGSIGLDYSDGIYISDVGFNISYFFIEFANRKTYDTQFYATLCNNKFTLTYQNTEFMVDNLRSFFQAGDNHDLIYSSYLINTKKYTSLEGIQLSYQPYVDRDDVITYYLMPNGSIVANISDSYLQTLGYETICSLTFNDGYQYKVFFTKLDMDKIFSLFNR